MTISNKDDCHCLPGGSESLAHTFTLSMNLFKGVLPSSSLSNYTFPVFTIERGLMQSKKFFYKVLYQQYDRSYSVGTMQIFFKVKEEKN